MVTPRCLIVWETVKIQKSGNGTQTEQLRRDTLRLHQMNAFLHLLSLLFFLALSMYVHQPNKFLLLLLLAFRWMIFKGLEYLNAGTHSYRVTLMLFSESFLSKKCVALKVNDAKKKKLETDTVRSWSLLLINAFSMTRACGQHFL